MESSLEEVKARLAEARAPAALCGAGLSAESGVPTFRGAGGLWNNYRAEELATPQAFERDPLLVWRWYDWRRSVVAGAAPNDGHHALKALEDSKGLVIITQNVDGLQEEAGSRDAIELHGSIWRLRCTGCGLEERNRDVPLELPPRCRCGALFRPAVVWFGEALDADVLRRAEQAVERTDLLFVIGTSGVVQPAASLAWSAKGRGAFVVEINIEQTPVSPMADAVLRGKAAQRLAELIRH
ncbi:MAG TPA: NAD-dependent deacylase [Deltaproteobacteria bacterium]|nr:NAD-dependent deacylase [Deltaproteobacteria bacterium]